MTNTVVPIRHADSIVDDITAREERIRQRAFELFQAHPDAMSAELDDWLAAEREVSQQPDIRLREVDGNFEIEAALPGVARRDLDVKVTGEDVLITAKREPMPTLAEPLVPTEEISTELFRAIHLPAPIDGEHVKAEFRKGLLRITAPIIRPVGPRPIEIHG